MFDTDDEDLDVSPEVLAALSRRRARAALLALAPSERPDGDRQLAAMF